jgi:muconolactone delta-isomerase
MNTTDKTEITAEAQKVPAQTDVQITRILAIGTGVRPLTAEDRTTILPKEVRATVDLYLQGKIDQWWFRGDGKGVVFLMNVTSVEDAHAMLEKLPLGVAKLMTFELMPLAPLKPLMVLLAQ